MTEYLFSYGTLQKENVQLELFGRRLTGSSDILRGYKLADIEILDEGFLAKGEDSQQKTLVHSKQEDHFVSGTCFEISEEELQTTDKYEPNNYKRMLVVLGSGRQAWIYVASGDN